MPAAWAPCEPVRCDSYRHPDAWLWTVPLSLCLSLALSVSLSLTRGVMSLPDASAFPGGSGCEKCDSLLKTCRGKMKKISLSLSVSVSLSLSLSSLHLLLPLYLFPLHPLLPLPLPPPLFFLFPPSPSCLPSPALTGMASVRCADREQSPPRLNPNRHRLPQLPESATSHVSENIIDCVSVCVRERERERDRVENWSLSGCGYFLASSINLSLFT